MEGARPVSDWSDPASALEVLPDAYADWHINTLGRIIAPIDQKIGTITTYGGAFLVLTGKNRAN